jgi:hypothetical protein
MSRTARIWLIVVALILAAIAFVLRVTGVDGGKAWWEIALPGIVALSLAFMLAGELRAGRGGRS